MTATALDEIRVALRVFDGKLTEAADRDALKRWNEQLAAIERESTVAIDCAVALLGESGAGKSSLLNALLGMDLLPHDAGSAVTAAITEIVAGEDAFQIVAEVESADQFLPRFRQVCQRLRDALDTGETDAPMAIDESDASVARAVTGMDIKDLLKAALKGQEEQVLLPEVRAALAQGPHMRWEFQATDLESAQDRCRQCLSSRKSLWPIVRRVAIRGPFPLLRSGIRLVDVPGLNDPDPLRNKVAQESLQGAQLVWLVLSAKRAMTGAIMQHLTESRLLTRLEMEGRLGSLIVIATHADQFDEQGLVHACGLRPDAPLDEFLARHKERVCDEVRKALLRAWDETISNADGHVGQETAASGRLRLREVPFFSVSSTESLLLRRVVKSRRGPSFERDEQSGIPELTRWLQKDFVAKEMQAHQDRIRTRVQQLRSAIRSTLGHREDILRKLANLHSDKKGGLKGSQNRAQTFLEERLVEHKVQASKEVDSQADHLRVAIRDGVDAAEAEIRVHVPERLAGIHWATLRAIVRRDGVFVGSTRHWDLPAEIAASVTKRVVFRWAELFEIDSKRFLDGVTHKSADLLAEHAHFLFGLIAQAVGDGLPGFDRLKQPTQQLELELDLIGTDITERLQAARMSFERDLIESLRHELRPAFEAAAEERGSGMKQRMVDGLTHHLNQIAPKLIPALTRDLNEKIVEVNGILDSQVHRAHDSVRRVAEIESHNLEVALFQKTPRELIAIADTIAEGLNQMERG